MDLFSYLLGKNANKGTTPSRNWSEIGYSSEPTYITNAFNYAKTLYDNFDITVTDWGGKYRDDTNLVIFPLVDTSNVTSMRSAFYGDVHLQYVPPLSITTNCTNTRYMFNNCASLREVDTTNFNTSEVTQMDNMFYKCTSLINISLPFDTGKVTTMESMFNDCFNLKEIDLSTFTSTALTTTKSMFYGCRLMTKIDLRNFNFSTISTTSDMFGGSASTGIPNNCLIIVKDATQKSWINSHFSRLTNVKTVAEYETNNK